MPGLSRERLPTLDLNPDPYTGSTLPGVLGDESSIVPEDRLPVPQPAAKSDISTHPDPETVPNGSDQIYGIGGPDITH